MRFKFSFGSITYTNYPNFSFPRFSFYLIRVGINMATRSLIGFWWQREVFLFRVVEGGLKPFAITDIILDFLFMEFKWSLEKDIDYE